MTGPLLLIVLGVLLLLRNLHPEQYPITRMWPVLVIAIGLGKVFDSLLRRRSGNRFENGKELK